jgi:hypothetical protein
MIAVDLECLIEECPTDMYVNGFDLSAVKHT